MGLTASTIVSRLKKQGDREVAARSQRFFKTGPGEYGEGDLFLGIRVPVLRRWARECRQLPREDARALLRSPYHEVRLLALLILVPQYAAARTDGERQEIYRDYLGHTAFINNWDLVDSSAHKIVGPHLAERSRRPLYRLAGSKSLWERRIAVIATFHFIRSDDFADSLALAERLLQDDEDLIHKAVGWMLREIGNRDRVVEERFLERHAARMPRTMLRYAIEKFPPAARRKYLRRRPSPRAGTRGSDSTNPRWSP